ncbi:MAG: cytochrome c [Phycisphaerales bacterium]|nr:cytochrome c [Phycisphaerales bacterium]
MNPTPAAAVAHTAARAAALSIAFAVAGGLLSGCATQKEANAGSAAADGPMVPPRSPHERVLDIMDAKLAYTQSVLQGVVLADFGQIQHNAQELANLSREARFMVEDSIAYALLSDRFRTSATQLAQDAAKEDLEAVTRGYTALVGSCVDCHRHLQQERIDNDMPGRVSWREIAPTQGS